MGNDRRTLTAVMAVLGLISAACGSTVPIQEQQVAEAAAEAGITDPSVIAGADGKLGTADDLGSVGDTTTSGTASGVGDVTGAGGSASTGTTSGSTSSGTGTVVAGENGPGITATTIKIGIMYTADAEEANAAVGGTAGQIDMKKANEAMFDYINSKGGVAGRKLVPVYAQYRALSNETADQQDQAACAKWTQDDKVFMTDGGLKTDTGLSCTEKAGTVQVATNGLRFQSDRFFARYPHYLEFDGLDNNDLSVMYVDSMKKLGYFEEGAKIGLLTWDDPEFIYPTQSSLIPRMAKYGVEFADIAYIKSPESNQEVGEAVAQVGNAAVRFKGSGITHVMFLDTGANLAFFFMQAAERQEYRPRYGLTSASGNTALADLLRAGGNESQARNQLEDAVSVGWTPAIDVKAEDLPAWSKSPTTKTCYAIMRRSGIGMSDGNARALAQGVCDSVWTMEASLEAAGSVINQDTWLAGLDRVEIVPTHGAGFSISSRRRDGVEVAAFMKWIEGCACFRYTSDPFTIPD